MKLLLILSLTILITLNLKAQETPDTDKNYKFSLGLNLSPDIAYRTLESESSVNWIKNLRDKSEGPKFGYTAGLNLQYKISQRFAFEGGVQYSNKGYQLKNTELTYGNMIDPRYEFEYQIIDGAPDNVRINYNFNYLDVPLRYIYSAGDRRIKFLVSLGLTTNILLNVTHTNIVEYKDGRVERNTYKNTMNNFKKINISPTVSAGVNYKLSDRFNISAEPSFRYGIIKINDNSITARLWNGGLNFTFYYSFK